MRRTATVTTMPRRRRLQVQTRSKSHKTLDAMADRIMTNDAFNDNRANSRQNTTSTLQHCAHDTQASKQHERTMQFKKSTTGSHQPAQAHKRGRTCAGVE